MAKQETVAEAMERAKFVVPDDAKQEKEDYEQSMKDCHNPSPCVFCRYDYFAFCNETGFCCHEYYQYTADPAAEKGFIDE